MQKAGSTEVSDLSKTPEEFTRGRFEQGKLAILNTQTGMVEQEVSTGYFPYAICLANGKLYVTVEGENKVQT